MKSNVIIMCIALHSMMLSGQLADDFTDGELLQNPTWYGQVDSFIVNSEQMLQLKAIGAGTSYLSIVSAGWDIQSWQSTIRFDFNPSARNFCKVYLASDRLNLTEDLHGIYVLIGGADDDISLYRQTPQGDEKLIDGLDDFLVEDEVYIQLLVDRSPQGEWSLRSRDLQTGTLTTHGARLDTAFVAGNYFGYYCSYTSTRSDKFFFDDMHTTGTKITDQVAPVLQSIRSVDSISFDLIFNEAVGPFFSIHQFTIAVLGAPKDIMHVQSNQVRLTLPQPMTSNTTYQVWGTDIPDLAGNLLSFQASITYEIPGKIEPYDIIISEIMADPNPSIGQPQTEYLELHNRSDKVLDLKDMMLSDKVKSTNLLSHQLTPGSYVILSPGPEVNFSDTTKVLLVKPWPSLNNSGDLISLKVNENLIHAVNYEMSWYRSELKQHGGWSLEMIDVNYPCSSQSNWVASGHVSGGTPGFANSVATFNPDHSPPIIINTYAPTSDSLLIEFNETIAEVPLSNDQLTFIPKLSLQSLAVVGPTQSTLAVKLNDHLDLNQVYQIKITGLADCHGNAITKEGASAQIGLIQEAITGDVVINELLFNPRPLGHRYLEICNRSMKAINLENWKLARWQQDNLIDIQLVTTVPTMIYPGDIKVFSENPNSVRHQYPACATAQITEISNLPALPDTEGSMVILDAKSQIIDEFYYHHNMHHPLLSDKNGVSLERVSTDQPSDLIENWASAATTQGSGTPGKANSQNGNLIHGNTVSVQPKVFSPWPGNSEYAKVSYDFDLAGNSILVSIYNSNGSHIIDLAKNQLAATAGVLLWDGTDKGQQIVPIGYYILYFRKIDLQGRVTQWKETIVVAPKL